MSKNDTRILYTRSDGNHIDTVEIEYSAQPEIHNIQEAEAGDSPTGIPAHYANCFAFGISLRTAGTGSFYVVCDSNGLFHNHAWFGMKVRGGHIKAKASVSGGVFRVRPQFLLPIPVPIDYW